MASKPAILERRRQIRSMLLLGYKEESIARQLGYGIATVERDVAWLRNNAAERGFGKTAKLLLGELILRQESRLRRLWTAVEDQKSEWKNKLRALSELRAEDELLVKLGEKAGILSREGQNIMINNINEKEKPLNVYEIIKQREREDELLNQWRLEQQKRYGRNTEESNIDSQDITASPTSS